MLKNNSIQFSVVREDPLIEISLFHRWEIQNPIFIGSGGCSAFSIASEFPNISITLIEPNPSQIKLIELKSKILRSNNINEIRNKFGIGSANKRQLSLIENGNFESLFRMFRNFIFEFIISEQSLKLLIQKGLKRDIEKLFKHAYWPVAFDLFFSNSLLLAMFGEAAIQHAPEESYGRYFREVLEKGLLRKDRKSNYFLHHIFFGHYLDKKSCWPHYLQKIPKVTNFKILNCMALDVADYSPFDFVGLSNIFDWSSEKEIKKLASKLNKELHQGSVLLFRQLNNNKDFRPYFKDHFQWYNEYSQKTLNVDRSLFYSSIHIARKIK